MTLQSVQPQPPAGEGENEELRARLTEAEETLDAIRSGAVDALVVSGPRGEQVYTLRGVDQTYRRLIEVMSEGAVVLTADGDILYCNRCFAEMVRLPMEKVIGGALRQFVSAEDRGAMQSVLARALEGSSTVGKQEFVLKTGDGHTVPAYLSATGLALDEEMTICLVVTDLTEQKRSQQLVAAGMKRLEEEQLRANKLESLGLLAGGLAHDLNNTLTTILGNVALAKRSVSSSSAGSQEDALRRLAKAEMACKQARDVTQQLLTFSKGGAPVKEPVSIARLLEDWAAFALSGSGVNCEFDLAPDLGRVELDKGQMSRVISNLLINAQQAMPQGGTVTIRARNVALDANVPENALPLPSGEYVRIDIHDTGSGIPESDLSKVFDPYFTTKQKGSGLGLSIAYSVVRAHDGYITVASDPGMGTTFRIYLPTSEDRPREKESVPQPQPQPASSPVLRVLVVDDQEAIRELMRSILVDIEGDEVEFASEGSQAIEMYRAAMEAGQPFDVVLLDLTITGGMGGKEAIEKLLEIDPRVKALVVSGYSNDPIMSQYQDYGFKGVIRKPFELDVFLDSLRSVATSA